MLSEKTALFHAVQDELVVSRAHAQLVVWRLVGKGQTRRIGVIDAYLSAPNQPRDDKRLAQMRVGSIVSSLNRKLKKHGVHIRPGHPRGTYALYPLT